MIVNYLRTVNSTSDIMFRYFRGASPEWPKAISLEVQYIMIANFEQNDYVGYSPQVNVKPEERIARYAHKTQQETRKRARGEYIPDLLGFYRCKRHQGDDAPSGIYLFIDKICKEAENAKIGVDSLATAVFYHEFTHLLAHTVALHKPAEIDDERNFEEPFCEVFSYYATFADQLPRNRVEILGRKVGFRCADSVFHYGLREVRENDGETFKSLGRAYPYRWFNHFMEITSTLTNSDELTLKLVEKALDGTLSTRSIGQVSCDRASIFLINAKPLRKYPQKDVERKFTAMLYAYKFH